MKMSDVFKGNVYSIYHDDKLVSLSDENGKFCMVNDCAKNEVITAINNHDALVNALEMLIDGESAHDLVGITGYSAEICQSDIIEVLAKAKGES